ncbi:hypothetical protein [Bradyrhizobium sp. CCBAU 51753]|uniref:hypothetical protein n=1 Tax=Bradyrhizobium sp. CCBAU 51753 TaxID=1325100 RepID=UPI00188A9F97|nr:hypothetical protein [Bradyrhizobium sp. CCBAU 51753]QOZ25311.1 hypothetical protein XH93_18220 [Bradyrhizobium sp. CCBAU 51753]
MQQRGTILALDVASKTGVAFGRPGEVPRLETVDFRGNDELPNFYGRAVEWMATRLRDDPPDMVVIERAVPPSGAQGFTNHDTTMITIGMFGIFAGITACKGVRLEFASINTWRKHFLGTAKLKRAEAKKAAIDRCRLLGWDAEDDNQADAAGIWDWAGQTFMGRTPDVLHLFGERKRA